MICWPYLLIVSVLYKLQQQMYIQEIWRIFDLDLEFFDQNIADLSVALFFYDEVQILHQGEVLASS